MIKSQFNQLTLNEKTPKYPLLSRYEKDGDNFVVLFSESNKGVVVFDLTNTWGIGHYYDHWTHNSGSWEDLSKDDYVTLIQQ
jgi:hypothetical protein